MNTFTLYCKSYRNDLDRAEVLAESVTRYNKENIPFYISVPRQDVELFKSRISTVNIIEDEEILNHLNIKIQENWVSQQIVKSNFWRLGISKNYVTLDSDCQFIKDFSVKDFMYNDEIPYTVCHEQKDLWGWSVLNKGELGFDPKISFTEDRLKVMNMFSRQSLIYDFGPIPVIWSSEVWKMLDEIMNANNLNWASIMQLCPSEFTWYGETLLYSQVIPIYPREPLFKVFHYPGQYRDYKQRGITLEQIAENYLGIVLNSGWHVPVKVLNY